MSLLTFDEIKQRATAVNLSLSQLCREAQISESTIQRWRRQDTDPLRKMRAVEAVLRRHEEAAPSV